MTTSTWFTIAWETIGLIVIGRFFWKHRPCGWWWLAVPLFAMVWPGALGQFTKPEGSL